MSSAGKKWNRVWVIYIWMKIVPFVNCTVHLYSQHAEVLSIFTKSKNISWDFKTISRINVSLETKFKAEKRAKLEVYKMQMKANQLIKFLFLLDACCTNKHTVLTASKETRWIGVHSLT